MKNKRLLNYCLSNWVSHFNIVHEQIVATHSVSVIFVSAQKPYLTDIYV